MVFVELLSKDSTNSKIVIKTKILRYRQRLKIFFRKVFNITRHLLIVCEADWDAVPNIT